MSRHFAKPPLTDRVMNMVVRGTLTETNDDRGVQTMGVELLAGERKEGVERFQNYGFSSVPTGETEVVVICPNGDRSSAIIVATDDRGARMTGLKPGEVAMYSEEGVSIVLASNEEIQITTRRIVGEVEDDIEIKVKRIRIIQAEEVVIQASQRVRMETPVLEVTGVVIEGAP